MSGVGGKLKQFSKFKSIQIFIWLKLYLRGLRTHYNSNSQHKLITIVLNRPDYGSILSTFTHQAYYRIFPFGRMTLVFNYRYHYIRYHI